MCYGSFSFSVRVYPRLYFLSQSNKYIIVIITRVPAASWKCQIIVDTVGLTVFPGRLFLQHQGGRFGVRGCEPCRKHVATYSLTPTTYLLIRTAKRPWIFFNTPFRAKRVTQVLPRLFLLLAVWLEWILLVPIDKLNSFRGNLLTSSDHFLQVLTNKSSGF